MKSRTSSSNPRSDKLARSSSGLEPQSNGTEEGEAALDLSSILGTLLRGKWTILATCLIVVGGVGGYSYTVTPVYETSSVVRIAQEGADAQTEIVEGASITEPPDLTSEMGMLQSSLDLSRRVVDRLRDTVAARDQEAFSVLVDAEKKSPLSKNKAARRVLEHVDFSPRPDRSMIEINVESENPEEAAIISNIYADEYKTLSRRKSRASVRAARTFLEEQERDTRQKIQRLEDQWETFARKNKVVGEGTGGGRISEKYDELKAQYDELKFERKNEKRQLDLLRRQLRELQPQVEKTMSEKQETENLKNRIEVIEREIAKKQAEIAEFYAKNSSLEKGEDKPPKIKNIQRDTKKLEKKRSNIIKKIVNKKTRKDIELDGVENPIKKVETLRTDIADKSLKVKELSAKIGAIGEEIKKYEERMKEIPKRRIQRDRIERKLSQAEEFHAKIVEELQRVTIKEESKLGYVEVVQKAFVPHSPVRPKTTQNLILGFLLGAGLGIGLAFLKEATSNEVRRPEDIEKRGYRLLGVVPEMTPEIERTFEGKDAVEVEGHRLSTRLMPLLNPWSPVTENYRLIQINLRESGKHASNTLLVTSAQQGEGKTVTATNLALTGALSGQNVLLIDADMRRPSSHELLGMSRTPGVSDILEDMPSTNQLKGRSKTSVLKKEANGSAKTSYWTNATPVDGLRFIPAGIPESAPATTFDSERFRRLVKATQHHFDLVVVDTPPTQATSDAVVIGTKTEARTAVVSAGGSDSRALDSVIGSLRRAGVEVAGVILNRLDEQTVGGFDEYSHTRYEKNVSAGNQRNVFSS